MANFIDKGGVLMIPILACSVVALAIFLERLICFSRMRSRGNGLAATIASMLKSGRTEEALESAKKSQSPMGRVLAQAIDAIGCDRETLETVIVNATDEEIRVLSINLQTLATIANIAPILGLLGTVLGMIKAFMVIQEMGGKVNASVLAGGIWEAMLTTAFGLFVALPVIAAHSYLVARVDRYEAQLQSGSVTFIKSISAPASDLSKQMSDSKRGISNAGSS
ncbi:MAG: MotA/TolQ/ExbB proton channel family protein [Desulfamplus sp.]|nr:MotA/TolQ/ExbB proton channel family protein [Desulfamplus sp.]